MNHQDFREIVFKKPTYQKGNELKYEISKVTKNLLSDDTSSAKTFGKDNGKILQQARTKANMTQENLANKLNVRKNVITEYECGTCVPDNKILNKLRNIFNIKFKI